MTFKDRDIKRLTDEWLRHKKIILAVDYDDTIFPFKHATKKECLEVIEIVKWAQEVGAYIMIHTASPKSRHEEITDYCLNHGLVIDSINKNPIADLMYGNEGKPYYNWQLDDRSGLYYGLDILIEAGIAVRETNEI